MRLNVFIASATGISRRAADKAVEAGRVRVNNLIPPAGQKVAAGDTVTLDGTSIMPAAQHITLMLNKPVGYVCSREGQGSRTVYDLLPAKYHQLKPIGRLDKNSSGLLLLTNDGQLAHQLTHPSKQKMKVYEVMLDKTLQPLHQQMISDHGVELDDGPSKFTIQKEDNYLIVSMREGRNRQIRRTFAAMGYKVAKLHRTYFANYHLGDLVIGQIKIV